jgi:recombination protein RecT
MTEIIHKPKTVADFLIAHSDKVDAVLPRHLTVERMTQIILDEIRKKPKLAQCTPTSLISSVIQCSKLGLEPGAPLNHAHLIPFENRKKGIIECQFQPGFQGLLKLVRQSGEIVSHCANEVYTKDKFNYCYGTNEKLEHIPADGERGDFWGAYSLIKLKSGGYEFKVLQKKDIEAIRARSKSPNQGPWVTDYDQMAIKTAIKRNLKNAPCSIELQMAIALDDAAEAGTQYKYNIFDAEPDDEPENDGNEKALENQSEEKYVNPFEHQLPGKGKKADEVAQQLTI